MNSQRIFKFSISRKSDNHNEANAKAVDQSATEEVLANASREENAVESVEVVICEMADADYSSFTWPSAVVLAQFIWWHRQEFSGKTVLEISSGLLQGNLKTVSASNTYRLQYEYQINQSTNQNQPIDRSTQQPVSQSINQLHTYPIH